MLKSITFSGSCLKFPASLQTLVDINSHIYHFQHEAMSVTCSCEPFDLKNKKNEKLTSQGCKILEYHHFQENIWHSVLLENSPSLQLNRD